MQALTQWFTDLSFRDPSLWVAVGSGLTVLLGFLFFGRRPMRGSQASVVASAIPMDGDPPAIARHDERRRAIRRAGLPTPVYVLDWKANRRSKPMESFVLDRSTGGLRLAMERSVAVGSTMAVKPSNAPPEFDWVKVVVRNCREIGDYWEIGVQFEVELDLGRLLMFG